MKILPKKSLGQNFLVNSKILNHIVNLGEIKSSDIVLEVGPGTGNLTEEIIKKNPKKIYLIEKDNNLIEFLKKKLDYNIEFINKDILEIESEKLSESKLIVFGNLPYNISTEILINWIVNIKKRGYLLLCIILNM